MAVATFNDDEKAAAVIAKIVVANAPDVSPALTAAIKTRRPSEILSDPSLHQTAQKIYKTWRSLEAQRDTRLAALISSGMAPESAMLAFNFAVAETCIQAALVGGRR